VHHIVVCKSSWPCYSPLPSETLYLLACVQSFVWIIDSSRVHRATARVLTDTGRLPSLLYLAYRNAGLQIAGEVPPRTWGSMPHATNSSYAGCSHGQARSSTACVLTTCQTYLYQPACARVVPPSISTVGSSAQRTEACRLHHGAMVEE